MNDLKECLVDKFDKNIININGREYISIDVFQSAVSEIAVLESLLGSIALRSKNDIKISENEAIEFISEKHELVDISYTDGVYIIKTK